MMHIFDDRESVGRAAADIFVQQSQEAVAARGAFTVALSGGGTPQHCYELLAEEPRRGQVSWPDVHVFWGDERCVPDDDPRNNARMARQTLLSRVPVDQAQVHPIRCSDDPAAAAIKYAEVLRIHLLAAARPGTQEKVVPELDLVFLGLGQNGHTASLLPGNPVLQENRRWVTEVTQVAGTKPEVPRITLTPMVINAARMAVFMAFGRDKAEVVRAVVQGPRDSDRLPAQLIQPTGGALIWLLDRQAASLLEPGWDKP